MGIVRIDCYILQVPIGGTFLDIGCCDGLYTDKLYQFVDKVYAFEANPFSYEDLKLKYDKFDSIEVVHALIGDGIGKRTFFPHPITKACSTVYACEGNQYADGIELDSISIDSFDIDDVSIIKIDIEGCEAEALRGMLETIEKFHPILLIEVHDHMNPGHIPYIKEILEKFKYSVISYPIEAYLQLGKVGPFTGQDLYKRHFYIMAK